MTLSKREDTVRLYTNTTPFYTRDMNGHPWGTLRPIPCEYQGIMSAFSFHQGQYLAISSPPSSCSPPPLSLFNWSLGRAGCSAWERSREPWVVGFAALSLVAVASSSLRGWSTGHLFAKWLQKMQNMINKFISSESGGRGTRDFWRKFIVGDVHCSSLFFRLCGLKKWIFAKACIFQSRLSAECLMVGNKNQEER